MKSGLSFFQMKNFQCSAQRTNELETSHFDLHFARILAAISPQKLLSRVEAGCLSELAKDIWEERRRPRTHSG